MNQTTHFISQLCWNPHAEQMALPLHVIDGGDLVDKMKARKAKLEVQGKDIPFWPSAKARYCTSDLKRGPISKFLRHWSGGQGRVVCAIGMRAEESTSRARKPVVKERTSVHTKSRTAYDWLPIHNFTLSDVWNTIGYELDEIRAIQARSHGSSPEKIFQSDFKAHPAYALGNERLSCALCIFGSLGDLRNGAAQNPTVYHEYVQMEIDSGCSFQANRWIGDVAPELLTAEMRSALQAAKTKKHTPHPQNILTDKSLQQLPLF